MMVFGKKLRHGLAAIAALGLAGTVMTGMAHTAAAQSHSTRLPVLVMGEDSDPSSVKRSSDIFKRVLAGLKGSMQRYGFRMVDEEFMAVDLGWKSTDRRPKTELIEAAKLANNAAQGNLRSRVMVLFRIHATSKNLSFSNKVTTRIDGEIYDIASNSFIDSFELAPAAYAAPADCNSICINEVVGGKAREIAQNLGDILAKKLEYVAYDQPEGMANAGSAGTAQAESQMLVPYTVTLNYFDTREALSIIGVMADEFPGYSSHDLLEKGAVTRKYEYVTNAKVSKLEEWLNILMIDMGYDVDKQINIDVQAGRIIIDKIVPTPDRPRSDDETSRFN
ncbi:hypothetical protein [Aestuariispira insulae]|uniref:Flagellar assembly T-like protein n=1 Tax=Aestuariispira insulae TaxID=1461337 RepID=A0A3D9HVP7_9PROT|nr:hypothetical protein [Aestuariispira insulae]RED53537.1 hypothetical protein DFP90_101328 [Aestuariispira insulae]